MPKVDDKRSNTCSGGVKGNPTSGIDNTGEDLQDEVMLKVVHRQKELMPVLGMATEGGITRLIERGKLTLPTMDVVNVDGKPVGWSEERWEMVLAAVRRQRPGVE